MTQEFEVYLDTQNCPFKELAERVWELGEEGAVLAGDGDSVYLAVSLERPTLSEALLYTLNYLHDKNVVVRGVIAPKSL